MADTPHDPHAQPAPGGHGHGHNNPMAQLWMAMSGASAGHHEEMPGVNAKSEKVGHEPDQFDARTIVYVPIVVAITLVVTYLIVQGAFAFVNGKEAAQAVEEQVKPDDSPEVVKRKEEANKTRVKEWNDRSARIRTWTPDPLVKSTPGEQPPRPVPEAQLEANRQVNRTRKDANGNTVTDPPFLRSFFDEGKNNAPKIYPEDLRPENFRDPWQNDAKLLAEPKWVVKDKLAVVPIDEMIHLVAHDDKWKGVLKVAEKPATVTPGTLGKPKMSAGGLTAPVPAAGETKDDGHKH